MFAFANNVDASKSLVKSVAASIKLYKEFLQTAKGKKVLYYYRNAAKLGNENAKKKGKKLEEALLNK